MSDAEEEFRDTIELGSQLILTETNLVPPNLALARIWEWIHGAGVETPSSEVLRSMLLSLADCEFVNLSDIRSLNPVQRLWLAALIARIGDVEDKFIIAAAGGLVNDTTPTER